jgi:type IV pilus assembly protein PilQ
MNAPRRIIKSSLRSLPLFAMLAACALPPATAQSPNAQAARIRVGGASSIGLVDNQVESVRMARTGKSIVVRLIFREPLVEVPDGVASTNPPSLSFDFDGMGNATGFLTRAFKGGDVEALDLVRNRGAVRAVFRLRSQMSYTADIENGVLVVKFSPLPKAGVATARASEAESDRGHSQGSMPVSPRLASGPTPSAVPAPKAAAAAKTGVDAPIAKPSLNLGAQGSSSPEVNGPAIKSVAHVEAPKTLDIPKLPTALPGGVKVASSSIASTGVVQNSAAVKAEVEPVKAIQPPSVAPSVVPAQLVETAKPPAMQSASVERRPVEQAKASTKVEPGQVHSIRAVDVQRTAEGGGRVTIDLSDDVPPTDIKQVGKTIVISFDRTTLAPSLSKRVSASGKGTPVQAITSSVTGDQAKISIEAAGKWKFNSYQSGRRLTVDVLPAVEGGGIAGEDEFHGEKMSLDFQNVDVRAALKAIGDFTHLNVVASDSVQGTLMLRLLDVKWDQALDTVLRVRGLDMRRDGSVIWVAPREEIAKREKDMLESRQQMSDVEALKTEYFALSYAKAEEVALLLTNEKQRILSKRGSASPDKRTNQVIIHDIPGGIEEARKVISKIDIYMRQVQIEARIVEASDTFGRSLGARLGVNNLQTSVFGGKVAVGGGLGSTANSSGQASGAGAGTAGSLSDSLSVNLPTLASANGAAPGVMSMVLFNNAATRFLNMELSALEADGRGKIVSSPRVVTADQEVALIEQGTELPYQEASSSGATSVSFRKANLSLKVEPHITPDGNIIMAVEINKDAPGGQTAGGIAINTKHVKTTVMVENGGTVVIGGIYTQDERTDVNKVPFLGDVPIAGALFRNKSRTESKTELLIFLTPTVLDMKAAND